ncbi:MAG: iron ABC transporter permease [Alphaproteobacteria bacterium]|nr:MAG: iron ABC transporter permease [Alphaproteobacteria bacterium]
MPLGLGWAGLALLPWHDLKDGFWTFSWLGSGWPVSGPAASGLAQAVTGAAPWLLPLVLALALPLLALGRPRGDRLRALILVGSGLGGLAWFLAQGFGIGLPAQLWPVMAALFGEQATQPGLGTGGVMAALGLLFVLTEGLAGRGAARGDAFTAGAIGLVVALVSLFIFLPVFAMMTGAFTGQEGGFAPGLAIERFTDDRIWGLDCITGDRSCGTAWNTVFLASLTGLTTTLLGLAFALVVARTGMPGRRSLRLISILPIITPPFVIGLALILFFGRSGVVTQTMWSWFGIPPSRWLYGLPGIWIAQTLAFTPIAFLVIIGVVEGVSPSLEEAAQTLRASPMRTFFTVTLPLIRPGLANAFLLSFIESMADFGNPIVLGGSFNVLATDIFFAIAGAQYDAARAAVLAVVLLGFTLCAFWAQNQWLGKKLYVTVTGKGDGGMALSLPKPVARVAAAVVYPWALFSLLIYLMILFGGFVEIWGRDHSLTLRHYADAFSIGWSEKFGLVWSGAAWNSFFTTFWVAAVSALPTALMGLLIAWLLARQNFAGKRAFEFGAMLSFAIPGTVIGVSYIIAFNVPPIEMTGTGIILIIAFVFRNMPVGIRAGVANFAQLDPSLDEASLTLRAGTFATLRKVLAPLLRPAFIAALVYSFVTAMTAISAVVFLVSARYDLATTYILGRVENGDYGLSIAYCSVLIVVMALSVLMMQLLFGARRLGRRAEAGGGAPILATG